MLDWTTALPSPPVFGVVVVQAEKSPDSKPSLKMTSALAVPTPTTRAATTTAAATKIRQTGKPARPLLPHDERSPAITETHSPPKPRSIGLKPRRDHVSRNCPGKRYLR